MGLAIRLAAEASLLPADRDHGRGIPCSLLAATATSTRKSHRVAGTGTIC
jgi:hypothetical protein